MTSPSESELILGFDQSPDHIGLALIEVGSGLPVCGESVRFTKKEIDEKPRNVPAQEYCRGVLDDPRWTSGVVAVAVEGSFAPKRWDKAKRSWVFFDNLWPDVDQLIELRGRIMCLAEERGFRTEIILPSQWQAEIGAAFTKRKLVKAISFAKAQITLGGLAPEWLSEDSADAIHIARVARTRLRTERLGDAQVELGLVTPQRTRARRSS